MKKIFCLSLSVFIFSFNLMAQDFDPASVEVKSTKVRDGIYMITGRGGNIGVSTGSDGVFIIDDQYAPLHEKIVGEIRKLSTKPIRFVVNTHWHGDHTGGNELMGKKGIEIVAHENVRKRMSVRNVMKALNRDVPPSPEVALPTVTFPNRMTIHLNGEEAEIVHFHAAHTDGDSVIHFKKSNVIHAGDIFFNGFYPFIDVDSGGSLKGIIMAVRGILGLADKDTKIIPGHGPLATKKDMEAYLKMLTTASLNIAKLVKDGKSVEQVVEADPLKKLNPKWGNGFMKPEVFTRISYRSLKGKN